MSTVLSAVAPYLTHSRRGLTLPHTEPSGVLSPSMSEAPEERRKHARMRVEFRVTLSFTSGRTAGEGKLLNVSEGGCAIESAKSLKTGDYVSLLIHPHDQGQPIAIESAAVRWVRGRDFGVEFVKIRPGELERLTQFAEPTKPGEGTE